jgi:Ca2+-binding RTX toxin-like protein
VPDRHSPGGLSTSGETLTDTARLSFSPAGEVVAHIVGTNGNDSLVGTSGVDTIEGLGGNDTLVGLAGNDSLLGGTGDDRYVVGTGDILSDSGGTDTVESSVSWTLGAGFENLTFTGTAVTSGSGNSLNNVITGSAGNNWLRGLEGNDTVNAGAGNDTIQMSNGSGTNYGADVIDGGSGIDTLDFGTAARSAVLVSLWSGSVSGGGTDGAGTATVVNVENVNGSAFRDSITGNAAANFLFGFDGNDVLDGREGNDRLEGGAGGDVYWFSTAPGSANADTIVGFVSGGEQIVLDAGVHPSLGPNGNFAAGDARFATGAGFNSGQDSSDRVIYNTTTGQLWYDADGNGSGTAQLIATLQGAPALAATDLMVTGSTSSNVPSEGNDSLVGTAGNDTIDGLGGDDTIDGLAGNDALDGGDGNDQVFGRAGDDNIEGGIGNNTLDGGSGNDSIASGLTPEFFGRQPYADRLIGGDGNDTLDGAGGGDTLEGGLGDDFYRVWDGDIALADPGGVDSVFTIDASWTLGSGFENLDTGPSDQGGSAASFLIGNELNNIVDGSETNDARIEGGAGNDTLYGSGRDGHSFIDGGDGDDLIHSGSGFHTIVGGAGDDDVFGGFRPETIDGGAGNDFLLGEDGADLITGGDGNDTLAGVNDLPFDFFNEFADTLNGGLGNDIYYVRGGETLVDSGGIDAVVTNVDWTLAAGFEAAWIEWQGVTVHGNELANSFTNFVWWADDESLPAPDTVFAGGGNDSYDGGWIAASIIFHGEAGDDVMHASGYARFTGGAGADVFVTAMAGPLQDPEHAPFERHFEVTDFTSGSDTLRLDASFHMTQLGTSGHFTSNDARFHAAAGATSAHDADDRVIYDTSNGDLWYDADGNGAGEAAYIGRLTGAPTLLATDIEVVNGTAPVAGQNINGTANNDTLIGGAGNDTINGQAGADLIQGQGGNDSLVGSTGWDTIQGGDGNDWMHGGGWSDTMTGGAGSDSFVWNDSGSNTRDTVTDFVSGTDELLFDNAAMTALGANGAWANGDGRFWAAAGATAGHDADDRLVYNTSNGNLYYDADGSGAGAAQVVATFQGGVSISAADITVI